MACTSEHWADWGAIADVKCPNSLGRIQLVPGDGEKINTEGIDGNLHFANALRRVAVHEITASMSEVSEGRDGLDGPDFVVRMHDADKPARTLECRDELARLDQTVRVYGEANYRVSSGCEPRCRLCNRRMFDGADNEWGLVWR